MAPFILNYRSYGDGQLHALVSSLPDKERVVPIEWETV
jgi:hypothetical protein